AKVPDGLTLAQDGRPFATFAITGAHGRLYFAERIAPWDGSKEIARQLRDAGAATTDAIALVEPIDHAPLVPDTLATEPTPDAHAEFGRDEAGVVEIRAHTPTTRLLVLRDNWYPGWRATVDGKPTPIYRVNGSFRGVVVPPGEHAI